MGTASTTTSSDFGSKTSATPNRRPASVLFLRRNPLAVAGIIVIALLILTSVFAPLLSPGSPIQVDILHKLASPTAHHPLGTDFFGRDLLSRILYGGRNTLAVAVIVILVAFVIGVPIGLLSGLAGGGIDNVIMRLVDAWLSFPSLVLAIALASAIGPSLRNAMLAITITTIPQFARMARGQALAVRSMLYIEAARAVGVDTLRLTWRYVMPNSMGPLIVQATLNLGGAILAAASLGFLGLGAQTPTAEWGADIAANTPYLREAPWVAIAPGVAIMLTVLACNVIGDAIVDWLNPRGRKV